MKLFNWLRSIKYDPLTEGMLAHEVSNQALRDDITLCYNQRHRPTSNPSTNPENYDPLNPPDGWAYDPYYELWIKTTQ